MDIGDDHLNQLHSHPIAAELMIEVKNLEKSFNGSQVLKGVSATFEAGKTNLIIGQSGSGKTVLLKSLLGIHGADAGTISFDGRIYSDMSDDDKRELRTE